MAASQGVKSLKIQNRRKSHFYPADWIAGVDYAENLNPQSDDEDDNFTLDDNDSENESDDEEDQ